MKIWFYIKPFDKAEKLRSYCKKWNKLLIFQCVVLCVAGNQQHQIKDNLVL